MQTSKRKLLAVPAALAAIFLTGCHWHHRRPGPPPGPGPAPGRGPGLGPGAGGGPGPGRGPGPGGMPPPRR